jgi:hypothetical protein
VKVEKLVETITQVKIYFQYILLIVESNDGLGGVKVGSTCDWGQRTRRIIHASMRIFKGGQ